MFALFGIGALNGLLECRIDVNPILAPSSTYLSRKLRSRLVESDRLMNMLAQAALGNYWQTIPHLHIGMTQHIAKMLSPFGFDPVLKLPINWGYDSFLSDVPQPFELIALGFLASIVLPIETGIAFITYSLFAFFSFFPAKPEIVRQHQLT